MRPASAVAILFATMSFMLAMYALLLVLEVAA